MDLPRPSEASHRLDRVNGKKRALSASPPLTSFPPAKRPLHRPTLPFSSRPLSLSSLPTNLPLFAEYLSVQKQLSLAELPPRELRGRWKRFVQKHNRSELAEGWYDPSLRKRLEERWEEENSVGGEEWGPELPREEGRGEEEAEEEEREEGEEGRKKTPRELRREEGLKAREAEREERREMQKRKEERTMEVLRRVARERFG